jgi:hypothetical protein
VTPVEKTRCDLYNMKINMIQEAVFFIIIATIGLCGIIFAHHLARWHIFWLWLFIRHFSPYKSGFGKSGEPDYRELRKTRKYRFYLWSIRITGCIFTAIALLLLVIALGQA